jgi:hypothetical protein
MGQHVNAENDLVPATREGAREQVRGQSSEISQPAVTEGKKEVLWPVEGRWLAPPMRGHRPQGETSSFRPDRHASPPWLPGQVALSHCLSSRRANMHALLVGERVGRPRVEAGGGCYR